MPDSVSVFNATGLCTYKWLGWLYAFYHKKERERERERETRAAADTLLLALIKANSHIVSCPWGRPWELRAAACQQPAGKWGLSPATAGQWILPTTR